MRIPCALCALFITTTTTTTLLRAEETIKESFPYTGYITARDVYIRSGPGKDYYPTDKVQRGQEVEVYRHDPGGWFAIRPPATSFSWVPARSLKVLEDNVAEVTKQDVTAYTGSRFSDVHDVRQVQLDRGELVEIVGEKRFSANSGSVAETWYKVSPPAGEFRWVYGKYVFRREHAVAGHPDASISTFARRKFNSAKEKLERAKPRPAKDNVRLVDYREPGERRGSFIARRRAARTPATVEVQEGGETRLRRRLEAVNLELSLAIAEEPDTWDFEGLRSRAKAILADAESALVRGRARRILRDLDHYEAIRGEYQLATGLREDIDRKNRLLETSVATKQDPSKATDEGSGFDGVGTLTPVRSRRPGAPKFALTDARGRVVMFVTPALDVDLEDFVGQRVGVSGVRGFIPALQSAHVTAKRVEPLERTVLKQ